MIRVKLAPEPANFDANVRRPGLSAIAELVGEPATLKRRGPRRKPVASTRDAIPSHAFPPFWTDAIDDLLRAYNRICAYMCCYIEPVAGTPSVDHMIPKSRRWDKVYEWSNYRLACQLINSRKSDLTSILDPFAVQNDWFELDLVAFQVKARRPLGAKRAKAVEQTLDLLNRGDCCRLREEYATNYWDGHIDFYYLVRRAPFVAMELQRQNRLCPADA